jgi:HAD superfamily hydrolase (TIGR01484 family)
VAAIPLAEARPVLARLRPGVLFSDVDGTLVGRSASLLAGLDGEATLAAPAALIAARRAGLEVVLVSGRTRAQLFEACRLLGLHDAIGELGTVLVRDGKAEIQWGETPRDLAATPAEALERSGALRTVLDQFAGRIEPHAPWHTGRQGTALLRGQVDAAEVNEILRAKGFDWAHLVDNGRLRGAYPHLGDGATHSFHLLPVGVSKARTAARYLAERGLARDRAAAVGDGPADLEMADAVGAMFLVANGAWAAERDPARPVIVTPSSAGGGFAEVVGALVHLLEEQRSAASDG